MNVPVLPLESPLHGAFLSSARGGVPLALSPHPGVGLDEVIEWVEQEREQIRALRVAHGAILFRGLDLREPEAFERLALAITPDLKNDYLGTSPRDAVTRYVFSASELPGYYPIPQHCEMSFLADPPHTLHFCCLVEPTPGSGETPLCDFRKVAASLRPDVRDRFRERRLRIIRNYVGPAGANRRDLWKLKRWDEMFLTTDREEVTRRAEAEGFECRWWNEDELSLVSEQPAFREHPATGEEVWFNHLQVFHLSTAPAEYRRIARLRPALRPWVLGRFSAAMVALKRSRVSAERQAMHVTWDDGSEIAAADVEEVRDRIWEHLVIVPWQQGDVLSIDNASTSHGRLPYEGPRLVVVAWA
jgi:alpha-ketoglutarate-dependent taurine dioxygenase